MDILAFTDIHGDHQRIAQWRDEKRLEKTQERRPDLLPDSADPSDPS
jgi:tRNA (guanine37-N1)-methyltransferase